MCVDPGCHPAPHAVQSCRQSTTLSAVVLQERLGIQQVSLSFSSVRKFAECDKTGGLICKLSLKQQSEEAHETAAEED